MYMSTNLLELLYGVHSAYSFVYVKMNAVQNSERSIANNYVAHFSER